MTNSFSAQDAFLCFLMMAFGGVGSIAAMIQEHTLAISRSDVMWFFVVVALIVVATLACGIALSFIMRTLLSDGSDGFRVNAGSVWAIYTVIGFIASVIFNLAVVSLSHCVNP